MLFQQLKKQQTMLNLNMDAGKSLSDSLIHQRAESRSKKNYNSCSLWNKNHIHRNTDKMKRQRTMYQMKEQGNTPEKQLNEMASIFLIHLLE